MQMNDARLLTFILSHHGETNIVKKETLQRCQCLALVKRNIVSQRSLCIKKIITLILSGVNV